MNALRSALNERAERTVRTALSGSGLAEPSATIVAAWRLGLSDEDEHLLDVVDDGSEPIVTRYNLWIAATGIAQIVGGLTAGFWGAMVALAGVFALKNARTRLSPALAIIVAHLAHEPERRSSVTDAFANFREETGRLLNAVGSAAEFDAAVLILREEEIVQRFGDYLQLVERCAVNAIL
ncbi:MAG: hypothetical protein QOE82_2277 [Thermoanaerobaculia bacterium]|jgi:hypothetical protein|nr:hypothetical protein [Thermoanaerobaculia bacterium]